MTDFVDAESYSAGQQTNISFKQIVLEHFRKISQLACVEFRGGYTATRTRNMGGVSFTESYYVPDTRETYINAVNMLHDLLLPLFDEQMEEEIEQLEEEFEQARKKQDEKNWKTRKLEMKRELFQRLSLLLHRLRYLEGKQIASE